MFSEPGATRLAALGACPWLLYFAPLALQYFRAVGAAVFSRRWRSGIFEMLALHNILRLGTAASINGVALLSQ